MAKRGELIASIVDSLESSPYTRGEVDFVVRWRVRGLKGEIAAEPCFGRRAENYEYAKQIRMLVLKLQKKLNGAPAGTRKALLALGAYSERSKIPRQHATLLDEIEALSAFGISEQYENSLLKTLQNLQEACATLLDPRQKVGDYHTLDRTKLLCAKAGFELIVGLEAGQPTNGDPFRSIANWLFEIVAPADAKAWRKSHLGEGADLRTHCEKVLASWRKNPDWRKLPDYMQRQTEWLRQLFAGIIALKSASSM